MNNLDYLKFHIYSDQPDIDIQTDTDIPTNNTDIPTNDTDIPTNNTDIPTISSEINKISKLLLGLLLLIIP